MKTLAANPWRSEAIVLLGAHPVKIHCKIQHFALMCSSLEIETVMEVSEKLSKISPETLKTVLRLLAVEPGQVDQYWSDVTGIEGLIQIRDKIVEVMSGDTVEERSEKDQALKKLQAIAESKNQAVIELLVAALQEMG